jgi:nucleoside-diphosphate-sugar epimerase
METNAGDGEAFNVVDDDRLTWQQVYQAYAGMVDSHPPLRSISVEEIGDMRKGDEPNDLKSWLITPFLLVPAMVRTSLRSPEMRRKIMQVPWLRLWKARLSRKILDAMKEGGNSHKTTTIETARSNRTRLPGKDLVELYATQSRFSNEKIKRVLGYRQRITFAEALDLIGGWLRYQRLLP